MHIQIRVIVNNGSKQFQVFYNGLNTLLHSEKGEKKMKCPKCGGLMVSQRFADYFITFYGFKCLNCGSIVDKTIVQNRLKPTTV